MSALEITLGYVALVSITLFVAMRLASGNAERSKP